MSHLSIDIRLIDETVLALDQKLIHKLLAAIPKKRDEYLARIRTLEEAFQHLQKFEESDAKLAVK